MLVRGITMKLIRILDCTVIVTFSVMADLGFARRAYCPGCQLLFDVGHLIKFWRRSVSISAPDRPSSDSLKLAYKTTRRGLVAAVPVFVAMVAGHKAMAMARPPRDSNRRGHRCFLRGTRILTPKGEVKVEDLTVGDLVTTIDGTAKAIKWIGSWNLTNTAVERWPGELLPVKVSRSALAQLIPHTDLFLSPFHSVYMDGLLDSGQEPGQRSQYRAL